MLLAEDHVPVGTMHGPPLANAALQCAAHVSSDTRNWSPGDTKN
jgi:hypothetical protein